jgi:hypothetical protein
MLARDLESLHSDAVDATGVGKAEQSATVPAAMGVEGIRWVIAGCARGTAEPRVWCAILLLQLVVQGLSASIAQAKLWMQ